VRIEAQINATRPDRSVLLSASAGSGKTHVLVRRMIHLMAAGVKPGEIAAATFTEKAAAQMKDKLYGTLAEAAREGMPVSELLELAPEEAPCPLTVSPEEMLSDLTASPDELRVGTIHALCLFILRRFPLEAGLPPDFVVMDESEIPVRRQSAVDSFMDTLRAGGLMEEYRTLTDAGLELRAVRELLTELLGKRCHIAKLALDHGGYDGLADAVLAGLGGGGDPATGTLADGRVRETAGRLAAYVRGHAIEVEGYLPALDGLAAVTDMAGFVNSFGKVKRFIYTKKKSGGLDFRAKSPLTTDIAKSAANHVEPSLKGKPLDKAAAELKAGHDGMFDEVKDEVNKAAAFHDREEAVKALASLFRLFGAVERLYAGANHREGLVDFDDLEVCAYRLLTGPDADRVLMSLESRVRHYLVDEFQDTGELQWGILRRLSSEAFSGMGAEGLKSPTLFAVGDAKQSIYRFRMANHMLMGVLKMEMESSIEPARRDFPELTHNFRSAPEILGVVDETFGRIFDGYSPSNVVRKDARGSVTLTVVDKGSEPDALADGIQAALGLPVWGRPGDGAGFGDMAVLLRSRTRLGAYEEALRKKGIPFKIVGGVGFFYQPEIRAVLGIINHLDNPADLLSLAGALKSPLFRLSDGEIEPLFTSTDPMAALGSVSPEAHRLVTRWRGLAGLTTVGRLVEDVVEESGALFAFGLSGGPSALLNIEKLAGLAREFDRRGGAGLSGFTGWVRAYRDNSELATADVELPGTEKFVSIMTVHAAKGLEFPVVFMPGLDRGTKGKAGRFIAGMEHRGTAALKTGALLGDNPGYALLKEEEKSAESDESARLLYVGMTRAMDHLFMTTGGKPGKDGGWKPEKGSWSARLLEAAPPSLFGGAEDLSRMPVVYSHPEGPAVRFGHKTSAVPSAASPSCGDTGTAARIAPLPVSPGILFISPSSLASHAAEGPDDARPYPATLRGTVIHKAIESFGRTGGYNVAGLARLTPGFGQLEERHRKALVADVESVVKLLLEDALIREILSPGVGKYFELPLILKVDGGVVQGFADLVVTAPDGVTVYDFKSGLSGLGCDAIISAYAPQLEAYRLAVSEAFGGGPAKACILLADQRELLSMP